MITKPIITADWIEKLAFYKIVGRETPTWDMVDTIDFIGEFSLIELEAQKSNLEQQLSEVQSKIDLY